MSTACAVRGSLCYLILVLVILLNGRGGRCPSGRIRKADNILAEVGG